LSQLISFYSNICDVKNTGCVGVEWIYFAPERDKRLAFRNMMINFRFLKMWRMCDFSRGHPISSH
jgi:hypothetical protein